MALMETEKLTGKALNWAAAKAQGALLRMTNGFIEAKYPDCAWDALPDYQEDLQRCKEIADREGIVVIPSGNHWIAGINIQELKHYPWMGRTPAQAILRCFISEKLGTEIEVPNELDEATMLLSALSGDEYSLIQLDLEQFAEDWAGGRRITGAVVKINNGEYDEIWVTDSSRPFEQNTSYEKLLLRPSVAPSI